MEALEGLRDNLEERECWDECLQVAQRRVEARPDEDSRLTYGHLLQRLGRNNEAIEQYCRLSQRNPLRHYNLVAACWQDNRPDEALDHLLRGLAEDPQRLWQKDYWDRFGDCWTLSGREFANAVLAHPLVRHKLSRSLKQGVKPRKLIPTGSRGWLLEKVLESSKSRASRPFRLRPPAAWLDS
jgi:tetratricopeptide (TPR) repeat protein